MTRKMQQRSKSSSSSMDTSTASETEEDRTSSEEMSTPQPSRSRSTPKPPNSSSRKVTISDQKVDVGGRRDRTSGKPLIRPTWPKTTLMTSQSNRLSPNYNSNAEEEEGEENEMMLTPFYEGYDVRDHLDKWRLTLPARLTINDWAYFVKTTRRRRDRSQVDRLVGDVCAGVLSMRELLHFSIESGSNCFIWANSGLSRKFLKNMKIGNQMIGRVHGEQLFKDKQCVANILEEYKFKEWISFASHICMDENGDLIRRNAQRICKHQYTGHYMSKCMDATDTSCPNREYKFCECFRKLHFMPEYFMFPHYYIMEKFLKRYETDVDFQKTTWLAKPSYLTGGKGFFMIRSSQEFRYFYQVRSDTCVRREGFVLQRYLTRPCHLAGNKVDVRMYLLISVLNGRRVCGFFHPGYVRQAAQLWGTKAGPGGLPSGDIFEHLTSRELFKLKNIKLPKRGGSDDSDDSDDEEEAPVQCIDYNLAVEQMTAGGKDSGKRRRDEKEQLFPFQGDDDEQEGGFTENQFDKYHFRFKFMVEVLCQKLDPIVRHKPGSFQIFGLDIFIDADTKPWLLEINSHVATEQIYDKDQCRVISNVVTEAICIHSELFQKSMQEESISVEIQQRDQKLFKLTRAQRMMTAKSQQEEIDELVRVLDKTEISTKRPPVFLQNFFWWYDTPANQWYKPWVTKKKPQKQEIAWYSRMFMDLITKDKMNCKKIFKADDQTRHHDNMDYFKHVYFREKLEKDIKKFETEKIAKREQMVANRRVEESGNNITLSLNNSEEPRSLEDDVLTETATDVVLKKMQNDEIARENAALELRAKNNSDLLDVVRVPLNPAVGLSKLAEKEKQRSKSQEKKLTKTPKDAKEKKERKMRKKGHRSKSRKPEE